MLEDGTNLVYQAETRDRFTVVIPLTLESEPFTVLVYNHANGVTPE